MNRVLKTLLVAALAVSAAQVKAHTNKTFLMPRSHGVNLPMEYTTFKELVGREDDNKFGGNIQATVFYQASTDNDDIARYFLFGNNKTITLQKTGAATTATSPINSSSVLDLGYLIHSSGLNPGGATVDQSDNGNRQASITLSPEQDAWGVRFDYFQDLDKILKGLYLYVNLPIVHVENDVELKVDSSNTIPQNIVSANAAGDSLQATLYNYFNGNFSNTSGAAPLTGNHNLQSALTNAKMAGDQSETGVADIDIALGYKFLNKEKYHAAIALAITIPTGNDADGVYVFEPIVGNGGHFGLGGDLCADARVWGDMDHNVKINFKMKYRYLFESDEKRTLGIKGRNWGQYHLLVKAGSAIGTPLTPAANVTTLNVDVTPGSQLDGILALAYNNGGFCFDLGYNLYHREREDVDLDAKFDDNVWAIAARNMDTNLQINGGASPFTVGINNVTDNATTAPISLLTKDSLDLAAAETPSQTTHAIYSSLGYIFKEWDYPLMLAVGGKYEWASRNSALEQWGIHGKIGIGF